MENNADNEILSEILQKKGSIPNPLKLMQKRPGTVQSFTSYMNQILESGPLSKKEKAIVSVAATAALRADHCINSKVLDAEKAGVSDDEIIQIMLIVSLVTGNSMLHTAYEAYNKGNNI
jgi:AhpD family alkylhydroperoxidase